MPDTAGNLYSEEVGQPNVHSQLLLVAEIAGETTTHATGAGAWWASVTYPTAPATVRDVKAQEMAISQLYSTTNYSTVAEPAYGVG